ncbi:LysM peptidoglycan-binding domain-containing protein [Tellurirhabdus rosea]|uniref:LysM peptidoglycan-binding domain-containing protein n=1 Tax=Tellurirhabdus rosea TaxID=2674997 RepID=UPI00224F4D04|nr:LysM peptidoglycan-binding domain-containing protein [Tellurirhabdus rosea]
MKNLFLSFLLTLVTAFTLSAQTLSAQTLSAQTTIPQAPRQVQFANLTVRLDDGARRIIQQDINTLVQSNRKYWEAKLDRVVLYFPIIERILTEEGVPVDFKYLAVQESSLAPDAVSSSSAVGYWQFKRETAQNHGLRVDDEIDERKSIVASTRAAASYLKTSQAQYSNWVSALFSYYLGATGISKIVPSDWVNATEITLTERTDRYMLRFFAHKIALESVLPSYRTANTLTLVEYPGAGGRTVADISTELGVDEYELRKHNRWVLGDQIPTDKEYVLAVPAALSQVASVRQKAQTAPRAQPAVASSKETGYPLLRRVASPRGRTDLVLYEINGLPGIQALRGDNAATLARKARISLGSLLRYNDMSERDAVTEGEVYYLAKKMRKATVPFHTVRAGETSRSISQLYGLRLKRLLKFNRLDRQERLQVGRVMWLREKRPRNEPVKINTDPAPTGTGTRPVIANNSPAAAPDRTASNNIPRNASERKVYQPKLVEGAPASQPTASQPTSRPATTAPVARPSAPRAGEATAQTSTRPQPSTPVGTTANTSERVVIIRPADGTTRSGSSTPVTASPAPAEAAMNSSVNSPITARPVEQPTVTTAPERVASRPAASTSKPATGGVRPATSVLKHTVEAGQTYFSISRLYGVSIDDLLAWNSLTLSDKLSVGQKLTIRDSPLSREADSTATGGKKPGASEDIIYHTVQKGETMFRISKQYEVSIEQIQQWNELSDNGVKEGQRIKIIKQM